jgi:ribosome maturation protein SDO1
MTNVISKLRVEGKIFEILVDLDKAIEFKKTGKGNFSEILETDVIFLDSKKGMRASGKDLMECFKTEDVNEIAARIIKNGDTQIPLEYKEKERDARFKQVVDFFVRNAVDPKSGRPYTPERIEKSLDEAGVSLTSKPVDSQLNEITSKLKVVLPLKIETKKVQLTIPVTYTGQVYEMLQGYKESEEWLSNGDLKVIVNIPVGFQMEFYDKLNAITHGSLVSEELKS